MPPCGSEQCGAGSAVFGVVPAIAIGTALLVGAFLVVLWAAGRRPDRLTLLVGLAVLALAFFVLPTRVHERYGYPFFALGVILAAISLRWRVAYVVLSVATFANMYVVLTTLYTDNPSISDWLGIGPAIRSEAGVAVIVLLHTVAFVWAALQLRTSAHERLADDLERASWDGEDRRTPTRPSSATARRRVWAPLRPAAAPPRAPLPAAAAAGTAPWLADGHRGDHADLVASGRARRARRRRAGSGTASTSARSGPTGAPRSAARAAVGSTGSTCGSWSSSSWRA